MEFIARLSIRHRFALLGLIALVAVALPTVPFVRDAYLQAETAQWEADSAVPVETLLKTIQLTQQHRGLSALVRGGDARAEPQRAAKQREADEAYEAMTRLMQAGSLGEEPLAAWRQAAQDWASLRERVSGGSISVSDAFAAHTALVARLLAMTDLLADAYGLSLDGDLGRSQLIRAAIGALPALAEDLGKARAKGAGMLAAHSTNATDVQALGLYIGEARDRLEAMERAFAKAGAASPGAQARLQAPVHEAVEQARQAVALATEQILRRESPTLDGATYVTRFTQAIDAQFVLATSAMKVLEGQLNEHAAERRDHLVWLAAALAAVGLAGGWFSVLAGRSILMQLGGEPADAVALARSIAAGDLASTIRVRAGDSGSIVAAVARMQEALRDIVATVRSSSESIATGSDQIAGGNTDLASRTEEQAASVQQTAATLESLSGAVRHNAESSRLASELAGTASAAAVRGGTVVGDVVTTMDEISASSRQIGDIIGLIDGIAFQTNILALNAAVEAARAGEQGRGFAVVAAEVRSLAQRSSEAARQIKTLVGANVERVEAGTRLVADAGTAMNGIVAEVKRVAALMGEITTAAAGQTDGIGQVAQAVTQIDRATQCNAALVEESAAAAESLRRQAARLVDAVSVFKLQPSA